MRTVYLTLAAALSGGVAVWVAFWLFESIVPQVPVAIPFEVESLTILLALLLAGAVFARLHRIPEAAAFLGGSGASWAIREVKPLSICQSDLLYRPCTGGEIASMVLPALVLLIAGGAIWAAAVARTRRSR